MRRLPIVRLVIAIALVATQVSAAEPAGPESKRLSRAKDYVNDEQWPKAIAELRVAVADPKETRKDEALYWLAHSLNQVSDRAAAVETINRLERDYPSSMWVKPARSLKIEIAVHMNRGDVLWYAAMPPPPPPPAPLPVPKAPSKLGPPDAPGKGMPAKVPMPPPPPPPGEIPVKVPPPMPPKIWYTEAYNRDADLRIQALGALMKIDPDQAISLLTDIVFETDDPNRASRAVFVLSQSTLPKARDVVVKVAKTGPEPAQIAAVKALGRLNGPNISSDLLQVYSTAGEPVKFQIVKSLGERADKSALERIVHSEKDAKLRYFAIEGLGQAGGVKQLSMMYQSASLDGRRSIVIGLFIAGADGELIQIAEAERRRGDAKLAGDVLERLRLLGTPKAKEYLQKVSEKR